MYTRFCISLLLKWVISTEFQGGSFDAWGPTAPGTPMLYYSQITQCSGRILLGYAPCRTLTGPDFQSVFNLELWASNAKLISYYMIFG